MGHDRPQSRLPQQNRDLGRHHAKAPRQRPRPYSLGQALNDAGKTQAAITAYQAALKIDPDYTDDIVNLGVAYLQVKRPDLAIVQLRRALELDPNQLSAHNAIATILADEGKMAEAVDRLQKALAIDPKYIGAYVTLGNVLERQGKLPEAVAQYERAVEIDPDSANARNNLGTALASLGQFDRAIAQYGAVLESDPQNSGTRFNLAIALTRNHTTAEAITQFREAIQSSPDLTPRLSAFVWELATSPKASVRDGPAAVALGQLAMELSGGGDLAVLDAVAAAYAEAGRFDRAVAVERQAVRLAIDQKKEALIYEALSREQNFTSLANPTTSRHPSRPTKKSAGRLRGEFGLIGQPPPLGSLARPC